MATRTTSVDRRILQHLIQAVPEDLPDEVIKAHLKQAALSHNLISELLRVNPGSVDKEAFMRALAGRDLIIKRFADPNILERVQALGGQFTQARMTEVPAGETLESLRRDYVIKFRTDWHFKQLDRGERLYITPSIGSQVVYLPNLVEGSLFCSFFTVDKDRKSVDEILASLPKVEGLTWIVGNTTTICRVLANHWNRTYEYLLPNTYTWTTDTWSREYALGNLYVGFFDRVVCVSYCGPWGARGDLGLFVLGVPQT